MGKPFGAINSGTQIELVGDSRLHKLEHFNQLSFKLTLVDETAAAISNPRGMTYDSLRGKILFLGEVSTITHVFEARPNGTVERKVALIGFDGPQDICWLGSDQFAIADQPATTNAGDIVICTITSVETTVTKSEETTYATGVDAVTSGKGISCCDYDPDEDKIFFTTQAKHTTGGTPWNVYSMVSSTGTVVTEFDILAALITTPSPDILTEVTALYRELNTSRIVLSSSTDLAYAEFAGTGGDPPEANNDFFSLGWVISDPDGMAVDYNSNNCFVIGASGFERRRVARAGGSATADQVMSSGGSSVDVIGTSYANISFDGSSPDLTLSIPCGGTYLLIASLVVLFGDDEGRELRVRFHDGSNPVGNEIRVNVPEKEVAETNLWAHYTLTEVVTFTGPATIKAQSYMDSSPDAAAWQQNMCSLKYILVSA